MALVANRRPIPAILPLGTADDFASACGIPTDAADALRLALETRAQRIDVGRCNDEVLQRRDDGRYVVHRRLAWVGVEAAGTMPVNLDGDPKQATRFRFQCVPGALTLALPADCGCRRPA